jgi:hypothetical protein
MAYDVYVPLLGSYSLVARVASALAGVKTLSVTVDGGTPIPISFNVSDGEHSWIYAQSESVVTLTPGYHVVRVTALTGGFNLNYLLVLLNPNLKPVANAGLSQNVGFNTLVKLDGSGSIDPDNGPLPLTYSWTQVLGTSVTLSDPKSPTPTFQTPSVSSQIFFVLVVSDGVSNNEDLVAIDVSTNYVLFTAVSPTIGGTVSGASIYGPGQAATITATPASGYEFTSWSGDLTGSTNPATIVMNSNFSIIANFKLAGLTKVTPSTVSASSTESASYSASAAIDGSTTTRWASAFSDPQWIMFDMGSAKSITTVVFDWETANATNYLLEGSNDASFATKTTLATKINMGAVDHRIDSLSGLTGTYRYYRMYGTARNTAYGYSIYEARFYTGGTAATYTIAASNGPNGTILPAGNVSVNQNANQTFTVTPGSAYVVDAVTVDGVSQGSISNYTFTNVIANHTINATFKPVSVNYTLTTFASPNTFGTVTMSPTGGTYTSGTVVTVTANPASGYIFDSWSGDASGTVSSTTVLMNSNKTVTAKFVLQGGPLVKQTVSSTSASSTESGANSAGMSIDNNTATRWSSLFSDPQWISFDMGSSKSITSVCPKTLRFQTSVYFRKQITGKKRWRSDPTQV